MARFSPQSMGAYAALWRPYNDIDIYVEDSSLKGLYERMFQTMLTGLAKVSAIIPLTNRDGVIAEASRLKKDVTRRRFFLIDGDFEWSVGTIKRIPNLYTLRCYSVENLAWDFRSIQIAAQKAAPEMSSGDVRAAIPLDELNSIGSSLLPLFITYAACHRLGSSCETIKFSVVRLIGDGQRSKLCPVKLRRRIRQVVRHACAEFGTVAFFAERRRVQRMLIQKRVAVERFVAGKDYLLTLLMFMFHERLGYKGNLRQLLALILIGSSPLEFDLRRAIRRSATKVI